MRITTGTLVARNGRKYSPRAIRLSSEGVGYGVENSTEYRDHSEFAFSTLRLNLGSLLEYWYGFTVQALYYFTGYLKATKWLFVQSNLPHACSGLHIDIF